MERRERVRARVFRGGVWLTRSREDFFGGGSTNRTKPPAPLEREREREYDEKEG